GRRPRVVDYLPRTSLAVIFHPSYVIGVISDGDSFGYQFTPGVKTCTLCLWANSKFPSLVTKFVRKYGWFFGYVALCSSRLTACSSARAPTHDGAPKKKHGMWALAQAVSLPLTSSPVIGRSFRFACRSALIMLVW